ncbi:MAG: hypothetical protein LBK60_11395 [Verrucomicrobiales bacterium]|nr:hypothetical protein [Verrucomicrobiales bacterium]
MNQSSHNVVLEHNLKDALLRVLQQVSWLRVVEVQNQPPFNWLIRLQCRNKTKIILGILVKAELSPSKFIASGYAKNIGASSVIPILALPLVSPRMAEICQAKGWNWLDTAGNYRLEIPDLILLQSTGHKATDKRPRPVANLSSAEAGNVIQALLLAGRDATWTQRELQAQATVSLGLVNKVVGYLRDEAFVEFQAGDKIRLKDPVSLLLAWRDAYRFSQHQRLSYFTLLRGNDLTDALYNAGLEGNIAYASFSAADRLQASHVRQSKTWLYVEKSLLEKLVEYTQAQPVGTGDNLVLLVPNNLGVFVPGEQSGIGIDEPRISCTNLVRTYVDLWHSGGRGQEAAEALFEQCIKIAWEVRVMI